MILVWIFQSWGLQNLIDIFFPAKQQLIFGWRFYRMWTIQKSILVTEFIWAQSREDSLCGFSQEGRGCFSLALFPNSSFEFSGILHVGPTKSLTFSRVFPKGCHVFFGEKKRPPFWPWDASTLALPCWPGKLGANHQWTEGSTDITGWAVGLPPHLWCHKTRKKKTHPWFCYRDSFGGVYQHGQ